MKQLEKGAPAAGGASAGGAGGLKRNDVVTVTVLEVRDGGLEVQAGDDGATGFIKRSDLGRDRDEQRPDRFQAGQKVDAMNRVKNLMPCFQNPTPSTIAKLVIDITPVTVNWLVTVKGCAPGMIASGIAPIQFENRMNTNAVNTHGR